MPYNLSSRRPTSASLMTEARTPGDSRQLDALVGGCALVAQADGWVTAEERRRLVARVQSLPALGLFGVDEAVQAFEALIDRFDKDPEDGEVVAEAAILRLRGRPGPAHLLVAAACSIAAADGGFDAEERAAILRICHLLAQATTLAASHASSPTGRPVEETAPVTSNLAPRRVTGHTLDIRV